MPHKGEGRATLLCLPSHHIFSMVGNRFALVRVPYAHGPVIPLDYDPMNLGGVNGI